MDKFFFDSWESIFRTTVITISAYIALVFILRISGKRTLSKMNSFDFIVTVALGSTLATVLLSKDVALADGVLALFLLVFLQFTATWFSVRSKRFDRLIKSTPVLLLYKGEILYNALKKERVAEDEIYAAAREKGIGSIKEIDAIVLETNGNLSVISEIKDAQQSVINSQKVNSIEK